MHLLLYEPCPSRCWHSTYPTKNNRPYFTLTQPNGQLHTSLTDPQYVSHSVLRSQPANSVVWASPDKAETRSCLPCRLSTSKQWHRSPAWQRLALCLRQLQQRNRLQLLLAWHRMSINRYTSLAVITAQASWASRQVCIPMILYTHRCVCDLTPIDAHDT